jgi:hypothetical protein
MNRFVIRPNQGVIKPKDSLDIQIVFHKDVLILIDKYKY